MAQRASIISQQSVASRTSSVSRTSSAFLDDVAIVPFPFPPDTTEDHQLPLELRARVARTASTNGRSSTYSRNSRFSAYSRTSRISEDRSSAVESAESLIADLRATEAHIEGAYERCRTKIRATKASLLHMERRRGSDFESAAWIIANTRQELKRLEAEAEECQAELEDVRRDIAEAGSCYRETMEMIEDEERRERLSCVFDDDTAELLQREKLRIMEKLRKTV